MNASVTNHEPPKIFAILLVVLSFCQFSLGGEPSPDSMTVEGRGYGKTPVAATNNAIHNAAENSLWSFLSPSVMTNNFPIIKEVIRNHANSRIKQYHVESMSYDKSARVYCATVKLTTSRLDLAEAVEAKIPPQKNSGGSNEIDKLKAEMILAKARAKSAVMLYASYVQLGFRRNISFSFDSISIVQSDFLKMAATFRAHYSISLSKDFMEYAHSLKVLETRAAKYSSQRYKTLVLVEFFPEGVNGARYLSFDRDNESLDYVSVDDFNQTIQNRCSYPYAFTIEYNAIPKSKSPKGNIPGRVLMGDLGEYLFLKKHSGKSLSKEELEILNNSEKSYRAYNAIPLKKYISLYAIDTLDMPCRKPCLIESDSIKAPYLNFLCASCEADLWWLSRPNWGRYSGYIEFKAPIDSIKPDLLKISTTVRIVEDGRVTSHSITGSSREFVIVDDNIDNDLIDAFKNY